MKKQYTVSVFTENKIGLLNRVSIIFTRRHINIQSITASESEVQGIHRYTIVIEENEILVQKVVKQLEKQVDVVKAFYHDNDQLIHQEIALFKVPTNSLAGSGEVEQIIRSFNARILAVHQDFTIIEQTGHKNETQQLFADLQPHGVLEFVRSGRVAITKPMKELKDYLAEVEFASDLQNTKNYTNGKA